MLSPKLTPLITNDNNTKLTDLLTLSNEDYSNNCIYYTEDEFKNLDENELSNLCSLLYTTDNLDYRIYILNNLHKINKDLCHEHFHKLLVQYLYNPLIELNEQTLVKIIKESILPLDLKYECAKLIYNEYREKDNDKETHLGYEMFVCILDKSNSEPPFQNNPNEYKLSTYVLDDGSVIWNKKFNILHTLIRLEIIQILAETNSYKSEVELFILQYLSDKQISEYERYKNILKIAENPNTKQNYVCYIFKTICLSDILSSRYIILGSQYIFNNNLFTDQDKYEIEQKIIRMCQDNMLYTLFRADAADFLLTTQGVTEYGRQVGRDTIILLGLNNNQRNNVYNNKQNVHDVSIDNSIKKIIKNIMNIEIKNTSENKETTYDDVCKDIIILFCKQNNIELTDNNININCIEDKNETNETNEYTTEDGYVITKQTEKKPENIRKLMSIKSSLGRFQIDRTMYSDVPKTQLLFVKVWKIINQHEHKEELIKRLFEEIIDMSGTCSTGHTSRLANIFSGFELNGEIIRINIDCKSEMLAVTMAKINKRIQDLTLSDKPEAEKYQSDLMEEMMWNSNLENRVNLNKFVRENIMSIREELYKDYVTEQKLINDETFEINFRSVLDKFNY